MLWIWRNLPAGLSFLIQPEILAVFFFVKMENWHIGRDKESLVFTKKGRKIMRKIKRKKGYAEKRPQKHIHLHKVF